MFKIKKQLSKLYVTSVLGNLSLTGAWVAILVSRGYSLVEIGIAETVFHMVSVIFEIPSGVLADVFGRKKMLVVSTIMGMVSDVIMILSCNLFMVCLSIAFRALSYNFSSGTGDALAYDSLKQVHMEGKFEKYIWWLGFALLFMELGGIVGSRLILKMPKIKYKWIFVIALLLVVTGLLTEHSGICWIMILGGFFAAIGDDFLQVRTNVILQDMFPSQQRATLISIESFSFSLIMIVLSPLAGFFFTYW